MLRARLSEPDDQASDPSNPNGPARHCWFLQCLRASLRQRKRVAGYSHGPQEAAAHESIDAARELSLCETHKIRVVEKVRQRQIAAGTGHLELLKEYESGPLGPIQALLSYGAPPSTELVVPARSTPKRAAEGRVRLRVRLPVTVLCFQNRRCCRRCRRPHTSPCD